MNSEVKFLKTCFKDDSTILEVGCGEGDLYEGLHSEYGIALHYCGVEVDKTKLAKGKWLHPRAKMFCIRDNRVFMPDGSASIVYVREDCLNRSLLEECWRLTSDILVIRTQSDHMWEYLYQVLPVAEIVKIDGESFVKARK